MEYLEFREESSVSSGDTQRRRKEFGVNRNGLAVRS